MFLEAATASEVGFMVCPYQQGHARIGDLWLVLHFYLFKISKMYTLSLFVCHQQKETWFLPRFYTFEGAFDMVFTVSLCFLLWSRI